MKNRERNYKLERNRRIGGSRMAPTTVGLTVIEEKVMALVVIFRLAM